MEEVRQGSLRQLRDCGVNLRISQIMNFLLKLRRRDETRKTKNVKLRSNTYTDYDLL